jgi:peptide/nickel transport system substrate-binding protein
MFIKLIGRLEHAPLGVQILAIAYRSGKAWNETGFSDKLFDAKLNEADGGPK